MSQNRSLFFAQESKVVLLHLHQSIDINRSKLFATRFRTLASV